MQEYKCLFVDHSNDIRDSSVICTMYKYCVIAVHIQQRFWELLALQIHWINKTEWNCRWYYSNNENVLNLLRTILFTTFYHFMHSSALIDARMHTNSTIVYERVCWFQASWCVWKSVTLFQNGCGNWININILDFIMNFWETNENSYSDFMLLVNHLFSIKLIFLLTTKSSL